MKVQIKSVKGDKFSIEVDGKDTVSAMKKKIEGEKSDWGCDRQKLILSGKVLKDDEIVENLALTESTFIVCMVTKAKAAPPVAPPPAAARRTPARAAR